MTKARSTDWLVICIISWVISGGDSAAVHLMPLNYNPETRVLYVYIVLAGIGFFLTTGSPKVI